MVAVTDSDYAVIAAKLLGSIGSADYYNGTVEHEFGEYNTVLRTTLIIYREPLLDPADASRSATRITDIVPVWWEFHLYGPGGELLTDFCWHTLRDFLL